MAECLDSEGLTRKVWSNGLRYHRPITNRRLLMDQVAFRKRLYVSWEPLKLCTSLEKLLGCYVVDVDYVDKPRTKYSTVLYRCNYDCKRKSPVAERKTWHVASPYPPIYYRELYFYKLCICSTVLLININRSAVCYFPSLDYPFNWRCRLIGRQILIREFHQEIDDGGL